SMSPVEVMIRTGSCGSQVELVLRQNTRKQMRCVTHAVGSSRRRRRRLIDELRSELGGRFSAGRPRILKGEKPADLPVWLPRTQLRAYRWCSPPRIGCAIMLCVPKIRFCNIGDEGRRGQAAM